MQHHTRKFSEWQDQNLKTEYLTSINMAELTRKKPILVQTLLQRIRPPKRKIPQVHNQTKPHYLTLFVIFPLNRKDSLAS